MISVGIDVPKEKIAMCIMKPYEEIISKPFELSHAEKDLEPVHIKSTSKDIRSNSFLIPTHFAGLICYLNI